MEQTKWLIRGNEPVTRQVWQMQLEGDTAAFRPGQFVEVAVPDFFLRRPISVADAQNGVLTLLYKVVGEGTRKMTTLTAGQPLDLLAPLGNGYALDKAGDRPLLIGGGVGVPPLYMLARCLREQDKTVEVLMGFNTAAEVFYADRMQALGCQVTVVTADGSCGRQGLVTDVLPNDYTYYYACGPKPMLDALIRCLGTSGEVSMEERMGCGFGVCMGCSIQTAFGAKRVCTDGPVFKAGEVML